jgi:hypothetical protein
VLDLVFIPACSRKDKDMLTTERPLTAERLRNALEKRDGRMISNFYAEDAQMRIIDRNNPPSKPREIKGRAAIATFWDDICSRDMSHQVGLSVSEGNRMAVTEDCVYPDGTKVFVMTALELQDGQIKRETVVQAWDE